jgi:putative polyhydroxyalkanoate system protein
LADLHILRKHALGLPKARKIAFQWAERAEKDFSMDCTYLEGTAQDEVAFSRSGVKGTLVVTPEKFELKATLGFLLGAFKGKIEGEIVKNLDTLLATESGKSGDAKPTAAKKAATKK